MEEKICQLVESYLRTGDKTFIEALLNLTNPTDAVAFALQCALQMHE